MKEKRVKLCNLNPSPRENPLYGVSVCEVGNVPVDVIESEIIFRQAGKFLEFRKAYDAIVPVLKQIPLLIRIMQ